MLNGARGATTGQKLHRNGWAIAEVILLATFFGLVAGQRAPDVNESHYLCKAKHFWDSNYCPGDIFLSSSFSHWAFYFSTGWLTRFCSLTTYAWIGRIATWIFLAAGWRAISRSLSSVPLMAVLTGIFFVILNKRLHLAGEWIVGGFEAKGIAYGFVLFAISAMVKQKWRWVWPLLGGASAFHVLVGGWAVLATGVCLLVSMIAPSIRLSGGAVSFKHVIQSQVLPLLVGGAIALIGVVPPLLAESGSANSDAANAIYVNQRVAHHVNFASFAIKNVARFVVLVLLWMTFNRWFLRSRYLEPVLRHRVKLIEVFALMALVFSLVGLLLSALAEQGGGGAVFANKFLRFYLFRLADFAVPLSMALVTGCILSRSLAEHADFPHRVCCSIFAGGILVAGALLVQERHTDVRPNADARTLKEDPSAPRRTVAVYNNWKKVCQWIAENTPRDAVFITPAQQQTFKWYASRAEVCCWKDVPQDPDAMAKWRKRIALLVEPQRDSELGVFVYSDQQLEELAKRFGATHLLAMQRSNELLPQSTELEQVYPADPTTRATFAVFEFNRESPP